MTTLTAVPYYHPREVSREVLEYMLVGREDILREVLDDLSSQARSHTRQHWLIRGPRGIGKTHLAGTIYYRVRDDDELRSAYLPIWLGESDAYEIYSAGVLLLKIAERLVEELRKAGDEKQACDLEKSIGEVSAEGDAPALFEEMSDILKNEAKKRNKIFLIIMENLDTMLGGFAPQNSKTEARRLRSLLMQDREFLFLSTTPTKYMKALSHPDEPLYGHLKERKLLPLSEEQIAQLFQKLGELACKPEMAGVLTDRGEGALRRRVIHRLTGGNPRAVVMAFYVVAGAHGIKEIVEKFKGLLNEQTPYFEARLARLAPRERAIVTAMSLCRENLTLQEIARLTRLPERSLSTQVARLYDEGHLGIVSGDGGKGTVYSVEDGLFRLWYQYRAGKEVIADLVRFLAIWYQGSELAEIVSKLEVEALSEGQSVLYRETVKRALLHVKRASEYAQSQKGKVEREKLWDECKAEKRSEQLRAGLILLFGRRFYEQGEYEVVIPAYRDLIARLGTSTQPELQKPVAMALFNLGITLGKLGRDEEELSAYRDLIARFGTSARPELQELVAMALFNLGITLGKLSRDEEAISVFQDFIARFGTSTRPELHELATTALAVLGVTLGKLGRDEEALDCLKDGITRLETDVRPELRAKLAICWITAGKFHFDLNHCKEGEEAAWKGFEIAIESPEIYAAFPIDVALKTAFTYLDLQSLKNLLDKLTDKGGKEAQTASVYSFVLEALIAAKPVSGKKRGKGQADRIRKVLARVPPELRQTVEEAFEMLVEERQKLHTLRQDQPGD